MVPRGCAAKRWQYGCSGADQLAMGIGQSLLSIWIEFAQHIPWALVTRDQSLLKNKMYQAPTSIYVGTRDEHPIGEQQAHSSPSEDVSHWLMFQSRHLPYRFVKF